jgi:hypothetical protein
MKRQGNNKIKDFRQPEAVIERSIRGHGGIGEARSGRVRSEVRGGDNMRRQRAKTAAGFKTRLASKIVRGGTIREQRVGGARSDWRKTTGCRRRINEKQVGSH